MVASGDVREALRFLVRWVGSGLEMVGRWTFSVPVPDAADARPSDVPSPHDAAHRRDGFPDPRG